MSERDTWNEWSAHVLGQLEAITNRFDRLETMILTKVDNVNERTIRAETKQAVMEEKVKHLNDRISNVEKDASEAQDSVTDVKVSMGKRVAVGGVSGGVVIAVVEAIKLLFGG